MSSPAYSPDFLSPASLDQNLPLTNEFPTSTTNLYVSNRCNAAQMQAMPLFDQPPPNAAAAPPPALMPMYPSYYLGGLPTPYFTPQYIVPTVIRTSATPQASSSSSHHMSAATSAAPLIYAPGHQHQPYFFCAPNVPAQSYGSKMAPHMRHYGPIDRRSGPNRNGTRYAVKFSTKPAPKKEEMRQTDIPECPTNASTSTDVDDSIAQVCDNQLENDDDAVDEPSAKAEIEESSIRSNENLIKNDGNSSPSGLKEDDTKIGDKKEVTPKENGYSKPEFNGNFAGHQSYRQNYRNYSKYENTQMSNHDNINSNQSGFVFGNGTSPPKNRKPRFRNNNVTVDARRMVDKVQDKLPDTCSREEFPDISSTKNAEMEENGAAVDVKNTTDWSKITKNLTKNQLQESSENNTKNSDFPTLMMENGAVEYQAPSSTDKAQQTDDLSTNGTPTPPPVGAARSPTADLSVVSTDLKEQTPPINGQNTGINLNTSTALNSKSWASLFGKRLEKDSSIESIITSAKSAINENSCDNKSPNESATQPEKTAANSMMAINTFAEISARNLKLAHCVSNRSENLVGNDEAAQNLGAFLQNYQLTHRGLPYQLRGLVNNGNWCYVNATLQALIACPPFVHLIRDLHSQLAARAASATPTLDAFVQFVGEFADKIGRRGPQDIDIGASFEPVYIYELLKNTNSANFKGNQEDAEEFLSLVLNNLHEEMMMCLNYTVHVPKHINDGDSNHNGLENGAEDGENDGQEWQQVGPNKKAMSKVSISPIANIFSGLLRNTVQQPASKVSANLESFFVLPLDIQADDVNSIPNAMHKMHRETIKTINKAKNDITILKRTTFQELPSVLILQLKYFVCNSEGNVKKLTKSIEYGMDLSIDRNMLTLSNNTKLDRYGRSYKLFAVVYHHGDTIEKGHYTADIFHGGFWVNVDDTKITPVNESHVLLTETIDSQSTPAAETNEPKSRTPYLLFYRRCDNFVEQRNYRYLNNNNNSYNNNNNNHSFISTNNSATQHVNEN